MKKHESVGANVVDSFLEINGSVSSENSLLKKGYSVLGTYENSIEGLGALNNDLADLKVNLNPSDLIKLKAENGLCILFMRPEETKSSTSDNKFENRFGHLSPHEKTDDPLILETLGFTPYKNITFLSAKELSAVLEDIIAEKGRENFRFRKISTTENSSVFNVQLYVDFKS